MVPKLDRVFRPRSWGRFWARRTVCNDESAFASASQPPDCRLLRMAPCNLTPPPPPYLRSAVVVPEQTCPPE